MARIRKSTVETAVAILKAAIPAAEFEGLPVITRPGMPPWSEEAHAFTLDVMTGTAAYREEWLAAPLRIVVAMLEEEMSREEDVPRVAPLALNPGRAEE